MKRARQRMPASVRRALEARRLLGKYRVFTFPGRQPAVA
jgi:hypothetical protein